ncbi:hypothetical protein GCM10009678_66520 [Actinomadura kijaniata]|uniref:DUF397 domain-containing protein n=1 Tax=Actinomadura namibiensis TaxID=182080 RepID=A0A7W3LY79_ACTNM|nr:DUF397 domain-containing protein [Actinomadura namibiensis]MBA8956554.1 hypothetical protein [Actinomadura namibiensis]
MKRSPADEHRLQWRKSSHSQGGSGNCVETAYAPALGVLIRDSKNVHGPVLVLQPQAWRELAATVKQNCPRL